MKFHLFQAVTTNGTGIHSIELFVLINFLILCNRSDHLNQLPCPNPNFQRASGRCLLRQMRVPRTLVHNGQKRRVCNAGVCVQTDHAATCSAVPEVIAGHRADDALEIYGAIQSITQCRLVDIKRISPSTTVFA